MDESPFALRVASVLMFAVDLDGKAIGTHEFHVEPQDDERIAVRSVAAFNVRVLGIPVYRYRHEASEQWADGCVRALSASTDDNGRKISVRAESTSSGLRITSGGRSRDETGCVRAFSYWRPEWLTAAQLLDPQTGLLEPASFTALGNATLTLLDGRTVQARHVRLDAGKLAIELWYSQGDQWLQLRSTTPEGRHLRYRRSDSPQ